METVASNKTLISIVAPVFNEAELIDEFYLRTRDVMDSLAERDFELILIDDGCTDGSYDRMSAIADDDSRVCLIKFSRNFGHQVAITAGIDYARGDAVIVMDSDLQDPPEIIGKFLEKWEEGFDVVYGLREQRQGETKAKLFTASLFYRVLRALTQIDVPVDVGDFRLMSGRAAAYFRQLREKDRFVRGLVSWIGFSQVAVPYPRDQRFAGTTKYPYRKMISFALDGITSFSSVPLRFASWLGYLASLLAFLYLGSVFVQKLMGITVPGFATIMVAMLFLGGVQLISLGVMGEYIGRIYNEIKARPLYIVEEVRGELNDTGAQRDPAAHPAATRTERRATFAPR